MADYIEAHTNELNEKGNRLVTRNGHLPCREVQTGLGPIEVSQPRVRDERPNESFSSSILPKYARRAPSLEAVIPTLYLKGISTGNFSNALEALLGQNAKGLSPNTIVRLKKSWENDFDAWQNRSLENKHYVYWRWSFRLLGSS